MKNIRVLITDDMALLSKIPQLIFSKLGCQTAIAYSGTQALNFIKSQHFDIVTTAIALPDINGITLTESLRAIQKPNQNLIISALTTCDNEKIKQRCFDAGMDAYLLKPFIEENANMLIQKFQMTKCTPQQKTIAYSNHPNYI